MSFGQERAKEFRLNKYLFAIFPIYFLATAAASFVVAGSGVKCYFIGRFFLYIYRSIGRIKIRLLVSSLVYPYFCKINFLFFIK